MLLKIKKKKAIKFSILAGLLLSLGYTHTALRNHYQSWCSHLETSRLLTRLKGNVVMNPYEIAQCTLNPVKILGENRAIHYPYFIKLPSHLCEGLTYEAELEARVRCQPPLKNFYKKQVGGSIWKPPKITAQKIFSVRKLASTDTLKINLYEKLRNWPGLQALTQAVWFGDFQGFPKPFIDFYYQAGLSHILALSGQHVGILAFFLSFLMSCIWIVARFPLARIKLCSLPLAALFLFILNPSLASVYRTFTFIVLSFWCLQRSFFPTPIQLLCSSIALGVLWDPFWSESAGYWLSGFGFLGIALFRGTASQKFYTYVRLCFWISLLVFPLQIFLFGSFNILSPLSSILLTGIWGVLWIPMGFILPLLSFFPAWMDLLENLWKFFISLHPRLSPIIEWGRVYSIRFSWVEFLLIQALWTSWILHCAKLSPRFLISRKRNDE